MIDEDLQDQEQLASHVWQLITTCEQYSGDQSKERQEALEYYNGEMNDVKPRPGRSTVVSSDTRAVVKKLMPSLMRTLLGNDKVVEYQPAGPGDEETSEQASSYVNHVVIKESGAENAIYDACFDALLVKTGILKWAAYERQEAKVYSYTGQELAVAEELEEDGSEVFDLVERDGGLVDFRVRRWDDAIDIRMEAVPRDAFLIDPGAQSIEEAAIVGERLVLTRSELVSRGYDRDAVYALSADDGRAEDNDDQSRQGDDWTDVDADVSRAMEEVILYEVYVRLDLDNDGVAELHKVCIAEGEQDETAEGRVILDMEPVNEAPYADVVAEREAHQFEGHSIAEDMRDIQRIKTALVRQTLDSVYQANAQNAAVDPSKLTKAGLEAVMEPKFGMPIFVKPGVDVRQAVQDRVTAFIGDKTFPMLSYFDEEGRDRTGVTDTSGGLDPEAFQNMTATSAQLMSDAGVAQAAMLIKSLSRGIRKAFRGILRLVIAHADQPRTVRLNGDWVEYDPRLWNSEMDCSINVGMGAGSRERDLAVLQMILSLHEKLIAAFGQDNPFVGADQLHHVLEKIVETAGFPSAAPFFKKPDPADIQRRMEAAKGPTPDQQKLQAQMQLEQMKAQARTQIEQAQMQADLTVKEAERENAMRLEMLKAEKDAEIARMKVEVDLLKHREKLELEWAKQGQDAHPGLDPFEQGALYHGG